MLSEIGLVCQLFCSLTYNFLLLAQSRNVTYLELTRFRGSCAIFVLNHGG